MPAICQSGCSSVVAVTLVDSFVTSVQLGSAVDNACALANKSTSTTVPALAVSFETR